MTTHNDDDRLDRYLDDLMSPAERAAFEAELETDPALREAVMLQSSIDGRLRGLFEPASPIAASTRADHRPRPIWRRPAFGLAFAASFFAAISAVVLVRLASPAPQERTITARRSYISPVQFFDRLESSGFEINWRCENDEQFAQVTRDGLGVPVLVRPADGLFVAGWRYTTGYEYVISSETLSLITRVDDEPVVVLLDTRARLDRERERKTLEAPSGALNVFRRDLGEIVLFELSRLETPSVLGSFYLPE